MNLSKSADPGNRLLYNESQAAPVLGLSRHRLIELRKLGVLPVIKVNKLNLYDVHRCKEILRQNFEIWDGPEGEQ
jgi:hypothetical protein